MQGTVRLVTVDGVEVARWPLPPGRRTDLQVVDALARVRLLADRNGLVLRVEDACPVLVELLQLCGLAELVLPSVEVGGEPQCGEQLRPDEVVVPDDPVA